MVGRIGVEQEGVCWSFNARMYRRVDAGDTTALWELE